MPRRKPPKGTVVAFALLVAVVLLLALGFYFVGDFAGALSFGILLVLLGVLWSVLTDERGALNTVADVILTSAVSALFALVVYLTWIGWQDGKGEYCTVRHPCDDPLVDPQFRFVALIVTLSLGAAVAAWLGRAFVATIWLVAIPSATAAVNTDVYDIEYGDLFAFGLFVTLALVLGAVSIATAILARLIRSREARSHG